MSTRQSTTGRIVAFDTALGRCAVRWSADGIAGVLLPSAATFDAPAIGDVADIPGVVGDAIGGMIAVLAGARRDLSSVPLDERGLDPFRRAVYAATRTIPPGATATYGHVARIVGRADAEAARDVGAALARNPYPILVPCHRVVAANGALTGFSAPGGIATKRRMLQLEGAPGYGQLGLFG
jgi:methylated-DNA-[protein]-cysteine S-methyltransferase